MLAVIVQPGDTLSGIAAEHGDSLLSVEAANPQLGNPDLIYAGDTIHLPSGGSAVISAPAPVAQDNAPVSSSSSPSALPQQPVASSSASSGGFSVPGVPDSFTSCVAYHESTNGTNPAAHGNVYGIIPASGHDVSGMSLSQQKQVFKQIYDSVGTAAWAPYDGC